jgi:hypothetical protein
MMSTGARGAGTLLAAWLVTAGCGGPRHAARATPPWTARLMHHGARTGAAGIPAVAAPVPTTSRGARDRDESAALVVGRIQAAGFRFGTDGSPGALWGYMRTSHQLVDAGHARPGDVVFFDTRTRLDDGPPSCADRLGIVENVDAEGRITFLELRAGRYQRGYVTPRYPFRRRDERGEVINTFLRPKRIEDAYGTRYFAGEMLCGVARIRQR